MAIPHGILIWATLQFPAGRFTQRTLLAARWRGDSSWLSRQWGRLSLRSLSRLRHASRWAISQGYFLGLGLGLIVSTTWVDDFR